MPPSRRKTPDKSTLEPLHKSKGLRDQVYKSVSMALRAGEFAPSQPLKEHEIAEALGVSRTPVREALAMLASDGVLSPAAKGYVVRVITQEEIGDVFEMRRLLEPYALQLCLEVMQPADHKRLRQALEDQERAHAAEDVAAFALANTAFRNTWIEKIRNTKLREDIHRYDYYAQYIQIVTLSSSATRQVVLDSLTKILQAIEAGDGPVLRERMLTHLSLAEERTRAAHEKMALSKT